MVSFIRIIERLMGGDFKTSTGHPLAPDDIKRFVEEVQKRIPELSGKDESEIESQVLEAIEWAIKNICRPIKEEVFTAEYADEGVEIGAYECYHPEIGTFYLLNYESWNADTGEAHTGFMLSTNKDEVLREFEKEVSYEREYRSGWI